jgi:hypothetical protein
MLNKLSNVDCMVQVTEAKKIGISGNVKPRIVKIG